MSPDRVAFFPLSDGIPLTEQFNEAMDRYKVRGYYPSAEKSIDVGLFIDNHIAILRANSGNRTYLPYYNRLLALTKILQHDNRSTTV